MNESTRGYRPLAPRTQLLGGGGEGGGGSPAGGSGPEEKRMRRASTACTECQRRRTRCTGPPYCTECSTHGRDCVFDEAADRRRKASAKRTQDQLDHYRTYLDDMLALIRDSDGSTVQLIVDTIRSGANPQHIRDTLTRILESNVGQPPPSHPGENNNISLNFSANPHSTTTRGDYYDPSC